MGSPWKAAPTTLRHMDPMMDHTVSLTHSFVRPPPNDGARSLAIAHVAIVLGSTVEPLRGPDGCGIHVGHDNTAPDTVSKSEKARL